MCTQCLLYSKYCFEEFLPKHFLSTWEGKLSECRIAFALPSSVSPGSRTVPASWQAYVSSSKSEYPYEYSTPIMIMFRRRNGCPENGMPCSAQLEQLLSGTPEVFRLFPYNWKVLKEARTALGATETLNQIKGDVDLILGLQHQVCVWWRKIGETFWMARAQCKKQNKTKNWRRST